MLSGFPRPPFLCLSPAAPAEGRPLPCSLACLPVSTPRGGGLLASPLLGVGRGGRMHSPRSQTVSHLRLALWILKAVVKDLGLPLLSLREPLQTQVLQASSMQAPRVHLLEAPQAHCTALRKTAERQGRTKRRKNKLPRERRVRAAGAGGKRWKR